MALEQQLTDILKQAMRDKDQTTADTVRMIKTRIMERRTAKGFSGNVDDALVLDVISAYRKLLVKAIDEFGDSDKAKDQVDKLRAEIALCERFLPKGMDEATVRALVKDRIATLGITDPKQLGRLMADLMKTHKGLVEPADIKRLATDELSKQ